MCNSGLYYDVNGNLVEGTPIRVANILRSVAKQYPHKQVYLFFNDIDQRKTDLLQTKIPESQTNFHVVVTHKDGNNLLLDLGNELDQSQGLHYFLFYDPYDASIDWASLFPFFRNWGEVLINHMVNDPVRAITQVKKDTTKNKYESTYLDAFENLVPFGSDKNAYEKRVEEIIDKLKGNRQYYVAAFPFFNTQNSLQYSLIHCTGNIEGFKLYKKTAWKTFGAKSSTKTPHMDNGQLLLDFSGEAIATTITDESCFVVLDIAKYINKAFSGKTNVPLNELWKLLDNHPIFPSAGYRNEIKYYLVNMFGAKLNTIINSENGKKETVVTFMKGVSQI